MQRWWERLSRSWLRAAAVAAVGAVAGALYARYVGCNTGTCPLTSTVWGAASFGAFTGAVIGWPARGEPRDGR
jgi:hypothetical protein